MTVTTTRRYRVTGMHCASCGLLVDDTLEDLPGITSSSSDVRAKCTVVEGDVDDATVVAAIAALGYQAFPDARVDDQCAGAVFGWLPI